jgi:acetylornithine deacetylase
MIDPIALARQLIDIPSTTENELEIARFLHRMLGDMGFASELQPVTETRFNVFAKASEQPHVILNSHIDTVPPWFESREDEQFIYGRGACDTKGIIAAMLAAGERLRQQRADFAFLFVVGEETDSIGAKYSAGALAGVRSKYILVGEPTESQFARASKGALTAFVRFDGVAAHSAYPERGDSAINKMVAAIAEINRDDWGEDEILGKTTVNVGVVRGGEKPNIIAGSAECEMIFRLASDYEHTLAKLDALVANHGGTITVSRGNPPQHMVVPDGAVSTIVAFNTDVPHLRSLGEPLLFGPGSILDAHGPNERIGKKELLDSVETYVDTVLSLCRAEVP